MPEALLLALPVVGGFLASVRLNLSKYRIARDTGHRLYFQVVFYALLLTGGAIIAANLVWLTAAVLSAVSASGPVPEGLLTDALQSAALNVQATHMQNAFLAFATGNVCHEVLNRLKNSEEKHLKRAIETNDFELMVAESLFKNMAMCITLRTNQVYIGIAVRGPNPVNPRRWLRILPLASGFRESNFKLQLRVNYAPMLQQIQDGKTDIMS